MTKRVLVTGATGFIGRHSLRPLIDRGFDIHATRHETRLDPDTSQKNEVSGSGTSASSHATWHDADLFEKDEVQRVCERVRPSHLLHFAWIATPGEFYTSPLNEDWKEATIQLVQAFQKNGGTQAVIAGSCAEYDWKVADKPLSEDAPCDPATLYGRAKNETRIVLEKFAKHTDMSLGWGRIFFLYGPHEPKSRFVAYIINELLAGNKALLTHGEQVRDFFYVQDVADAFCALLDSDVRGAVNVASGEPVTLKEIALEIARQLGKEEHLVFGAKEATPNEPARLVADVTRLSKEVGWKPRLTLEDGLQETIAWWRENSSTSSRDDRA